MALISLVGADTPPTVTSDKSEKCPIEIYFGVFFDGTCNNMVPAFTSIKLRKLLLAENNKIKNEQNILRSEADVVKNNPVEKPYQKYSNVAILHSYYLACEPDVKKVRYKIYVEGAGKYETDLGDNFIGSGFGLGKTGVVALVSKAVRQVMITLKGYPYPDSKNVSLHFDIFGFSRGATCARLFAYLIGRGNEKTLESAREKEFSKYSAKEFYTEGRLNFINKEEWQAVTIDYLGIFDTVASIGFLRRKDLENKDIVNGLSKVFVNNEDFKENFHDKNNVEYGLYSPQMPEVQSTCHICAMDEFRENFALLDIGEKVPKNSIEMFLPGCHSDIGGGYRNGEYSKTNLKDIQQLRYIISDPQSEKLKVARVNSNTMIELGWAKSKEEIKETENTIKIEHKVPYNFGNVPLRLMMTRMLNQLKDRKNIFETNIKAIYEVPTELNEFYSNAENIITTENAVRKFIYPNGGYGGKDYQTLRMNYLHFTSTDTIIAKLALGANTFRISEDDECNVICRIVYHGNCPDDKDDKAMHYMHDYNETYIEGGQIIRNPPETILKKKLIFK